MEGNAHEELFDWKTNGETSKVAEVCTMGRFDLVERRAGTK